MEPRPIHLLLLLLLLSLRPSADANSLYTIDSVSLSVAPRGEVASGANVTLRCEVSVSQASSLQMTHHFLFLRDDVQVHAANSSGGSALFRLAPARAAHSGTYQCEVRVQDKSKSSSSHKLTVTGLQTPVLQLSSTDLYDGQEVTATCAASQEVGPLAFHFYLGEDMVKTVRSAPRGNSVTTRLELKHAGNWKLYCSYAVTMVPDAGLSNHSNTVSVMVKALNIVPTMSVKPSQRVVEGDRVEIHCQVYRPPPGTVVFLTKDRRVLKDTAGAGASVLVHVLGSARPEDSGEYECRAETSNVQKKTAQKVTVEEIFSRPELGVAPRDVFEGERFTLSCRVSHHAVARISPEDIQYVHYRGGVALAAAGGNYSATASPSANGNYTCRAQAESPGRRVGKHSAPLLIQARVPVSPPLLSVVGGRVILGKPFRLECLSLEGSPPISYALHGPDGRPAARVVASGREPAVFNVSSVESSAAVGGFACSAQNNPRTAPRRSTARQLQDHTTIIEPVSGPQLAVSPGGGDAAEGQDVTLVCSVQRGTPPFTFTWYRSQSSAPLAFRKTSELSGSHTIRGVRRDHGGGYYCVTDNQSNDSKRSATVTVGVRMAGWKKGLISAFCVLLLILLLLVFLIKKGLHPLKRKTRSTELSVKPAGTRTDREEGVTLKLVNEAANVTPGVMGRSVWSEHVSGSESDDPSGEEGRGCPPPPPDIPETQYTEVQPPQVDPNRAPVTPGTDTVYSEVRSSGLQGAMETADGGSVEYAQLNHDDRGKHCDVSHHGDHGNNHNDPGDHANHNGRGDNGDHGDRAE